MKLITLKRIQNIFYLALIVISLMSSCKKKNGDGELKPVEVIPPDIETLSGTITSPRVLYNRFADPNVLDYKVPASVNIATTLTIMPGVMIEMGPGAKFTVAPQGRVICLGTADSNVVFTGRQKNPGYWDYIMIGSPDSTNQLSYTVVEYGGGNPSQNANLILNNIAMLKMQNSKIRYSESYGMSIQQSDSRLVGFKNNTIQESGLAPMKICSSQITSIDSTSILNLQNVYNYIEVIGSDILYPQTWHKTNVPFYLTNATTVDAALNIEHGARFIFGPAGSILVNGIGSLNAIGLQTDSIYFSGAQNIAGYWDCILFLSSNPNNEFKYVSVRHGGGNWYWNASIYLHGAYFKISYSTINSSYRWGIYRNGVYQFVNGGFNNFNGNGNGPIGP